MLLNIKFTIQKFYAFLGDIKLDILHITYQHATSQNIENGHVTTKQAASVQDIKLLAATPDNSLERDSALITILSRNIKQNLNPLLSVSIAQSPSHANPNGNLFPLFTY